MCDRRSRDSRSMVWYSSSMPMLRLGGFIGSPFGRSCAGFPRCRRLLRGRVLRLGGLIRVAAQEGAPAVLGSHAGMLVGLADRQLRDGVHDPVEVFLADRVYISVGRGIHEVDGVRDAVFAGKLDGVE